MSKHLFQDIPVAERLRYLQDNAYRVEPKYSYLRELDENEIRERQDQLSQNLIAMDRADQVLKEAKEVFNAETKPLKEQNKQYLQEIRVRGEEIVGEVFLMKDEAGETMSVYSPQGKHLFTRGLLPEERQFSIVDNFNKDKNGTY